jgi:hypothetical protein
MYEVTINDGFKDYKKTLTYEEVQELEDQLMFENECKMENDPYSIPVVIRSIKEVEDVSRS